MESVCEDYFLSSCMGLSCHVRNKIMYVLSWKNVDALTWVLLFWCLFPSLLCNLGNKHQNNILVSASMVCPSTTYISFYISVIKLKPSPVPHICAVVNEMHAPMNIIGIKHGKSLVNMVLLSCWMSKLPLFNWQAERRGVSSGSTTKPHKS